MNTTNYYIVVFGSIICFMLGFIASQLSAILGTLKGMAGL